MISAGYVKRKVPIDIIFSEKSLVPANNKFFNDLAKWQDVPIICLDPYLTAISSLLNAKGSLDRLLEIEVMRRHPESIDTDNLKNELQEEISASKKLFGRKFPVIDSFERDRLILREGNIQCCLAKLEGKEWIDVQMPANVAKEWDSRSTAELDAAIAVQPDRDTFYTPIMHEKYRKKKVSRKGVRRLDFIRKFIGPTKKNLSLLDIGCNTAFYTFHFYRQGFEVVGIDVDKEHLAIARSQRSMYRADIPLEEIPMQEFKSDKKFDIVLGMSVFWHLLGWGIYPVSLTPEQLGEVLDRLVGHALFWEGGKRGEEEIDLIKNFTGLKHYTHLGYTSATGIDNREFGVFTRLPAEETQQVFRNC